MKLIAGVDIGNSTTEVCIARVDEDNNIKFLSSYMVSTTGTKGTEENVSGIIECLEKALKNINMSLTDLDVIRLNEAAPVIGDTAMETITETIITESTMIGHNPSTPGGMGLGIGEIVDISNLSIMEKGKKVIVVIPENIDYEEAAQRINYAVDKGIDVVGAIVQSDEGVLIANRVKKIIPIVDEVKGIDRIPFKMTGAVEVAPSGHIIKTLSNPYGIATIFNLSQEETRYVVPIAKSLTGNRSAVVIKTPKGEVKERVIPAGILHIHGQNTKYSIDLDSGADEIMKAVENAGVLQDVEGESGTNVGGMINGVKNTMAELTGQNIEDIKIKDILAIDTTIPLKVSGGLAGETSMEKAVAVAAMVRAHRLPMEKIAKKLEKEIGIYTHIAGIEAVMAVIGALTTPGTALPIAVLDLGGGSTDAAILEKDGTVKSIHLAGAGELVTMLINSELGLNDRSVSEEIKKNPVAKVESLFHVRMENGEIKFFKEPLEPKYFGRVVVLKDSEMIPIYKDISMEKIVQVRRAIKHKIFVKNTLRALKAVAPMNNIRNIPNVVMVGGSALDFEIPNMILEELSKYKVISGRGNIRSTEGPRNAVATGLVMSYIG